MTALLPLKPLRERFGVLTQTDAWHAGLRYGGHVLRLTLDTLDLARQPVRPLVLVRDDRDVAGRVELVKPRLLDLFCGAGGAAMGYARAGFEVVGVDINPQPHYPFEFHQADALTYPLDGFDAIHASPPCQAYSMMTRDHSKHPDLYAVTRDRLLTMGTPWVIENVIGSPYNHGIVLCGSMFGLGIRRHRNFEMRDLMLMPLVCDHRGERPVTISTTNGVAESAVVVDYKHSRLASFTVGRELMGMPWAKTQREIGLAIPPAYTEWIGRQLLAAIERAA